MKRVILLILVLIPVLLTATAGDVGIIFSFANSKVTTNGSNYYYEFDVMAQASTSSDPLTRLGLGIVYINYNTSAFGEYIYNVTPVLSKVNVTKGALLSAPLLYSLIFNNNSPSRLAVTYFFNGDGIEYPGTELPTMPTQLLHYKILIADANQLSGISFESTYPTMSGNEYYDDNSTWYYPVTATATLNDTMPIATAATATCHNGFTAHWNTVTGATSYRLDVFLADGVTYVTGYNNKTVTHNIDRVEFVGVSGTYQYRVRADNGSLGAYSNVITVSTTSVVVGTSASTSILGDPVSIDIPDVTTDPSFTDNDVVIDPNVTTSNDYTIVITWHPTGYDGMPNIRLVCTVTCSDNSALNGVYDIHHVGMGFIPTAARFKWNGTWYAVSNTSTLLNSIVTIGGLSKGSRAELIIALDDGTGTLPVELSSFTAIATPQNYVRLDWITQSETGVMGFYIYRNTIENLNSAEVVSPLVTATNTSQEVSYSYTDREIQTDGIYYYWLQNQDINGDFEFHGPVSAQIHNTNNDTPVIPLTTKLNMPYPNPFNPNLMIGFDLSKAEHVQIVIYNCRGQLVKTMLDSEKNPGHIRLVWDGKSDAGANMPTGMYYIKMSAGRYSETMKAVLMK